MIKKILFILFLLFTSINFAVSATQNNFDDVYVHQKERKLTEDEVKERGLDLQVAELLETADQEVLKKMARSSIFETKYGFRWKMINTISGEIVIIKVDKKFKLIELKSKGLY